MSIATFRWRDVAPRVIARQIRALAESVGHTVYVSLRNGRVVVESEFAITDDYVGAFDLHSAEDLIIDKLVDAERSEIPTERTRGSR